MRLGGFYNCQSQTMPNVVSKNEDKNFEDSSNSNKMHF